MTTVLTVGQYPAITPEDAKTLRQYFPWPDNRTAEERRKLSEKVVFVFKLTGSNMADITHLWMSITPMNGATPYVSLIGYRSYKNSCGTFMLGFRGPYVDNFGKLQYSALAA